MLEMNKTNKSGKWRELLDEFRVVFAGQTPFLDVILARIVTILLNTFVSLNAALWGALIFSVLMAIIRLSKKQSVISAFAGTGSVVLAIAVVWFLGRAEGFYLPDLISGCLTVLLALMSWVFGKPIVAWTSCIARRWPLAWYWHPQVRPAYSEVTFVWTILFGLRLFWQATLFQQQDANQLGWFNTLTGWPATIVLLGVSYLYGSWRLAQLHGPSVEEFINKTPAPWLGQRRGF
jgi:hypothetical protein